jgi:hypothetical protein
MANLTTEAIVDLVDELGNILTDDSGEVIVILLPQACM